MKKWIVKVSWVHDWTVTSHLTIEALTAGAVRNYIQHAWPDHKVVSVEPHWEMDPDEKQAADDQQQMRDWNEA